jgi:hypothetical protein
VTECYRAGTRHENGRMLEELVRNDGLASQARVVRALRSAGVAADAPTLILPAIGATDPIR